MRYLKIFGFVGLLGICFLAAAPNAHAQSWSVGVGIGGPGYYDYPAYDYGLPPVCTYGYYDYYPYACAPYGYYGADWFFGGLFIGAGPWYSGWYGRPWGWGWGHPWGGWGWGSHRYYGGGYGYGYPGLYGGGYMPPLYGVGLTPLGTQSYMIETQLFGRRSAR